MKKISLICVLLLLSLTTLFYVTLGKSTNGKAINEESEQLLEAIDGGFKDGKPDGQVIIRMQDGNKFKGIYKNGKRNGPAIEENKEGIRFEGSYKDDERDGPFVEKDRNGQVKVTGTYENGRRIED